MGEEVDYIPIATLSLQNDSCTKMGSEESHVSVSLIVKDKVTKMPTKESRSGHNPSLTSVTPYRWAKPAHACMISLAFVIIP